MSSSVFWVFPNQLYWPTQATAGHAQVCLIEEPLFFGDKKYPIRHHWQQLILLRSAIERYREKLEKQLPVTHYRHPTSLDTVCEELRLLGVQRVVCYDVIDDVLSKRILRTVVHHGLQVSFVESPNFLTSSSDNRAFASTKEVFSQTQYYVWQRKRLRILLDGAGPVGGKWSFDSHNRQALPNSQALPSDPPQFLLKHHQRIYNDLVDSGAMGLGDPGSAESWVYPIDHEEAHQLLSYFVTHRLKNFGVFQDALSQRSHSLFHSLLSSSLNMGLLQPQDVVRAVISAFQQQSLPISSVEGFLRQIIGWREYVRLMYQLKGVQLRNANYFGHTRTLTDAWYQGSTGIPLLDSVILKAHSTAYTHHIERLMVVGNIMLMCEINPHQIYTWFMEHSIDAFDWVMVPNVYGMSQFAAGPLMTTKPYLSGSAYLKKMGATRGDWEQVVDGLYWRFLSRHKDQLASNPRMSLMRSMLSKMPDDTLNNHLSVAEAFIERVSACDDKSKNGIGKDLLP